MLGGVFFERTHHARDLGIVDDAPRAARRDIMIGDSEGEAWLGDPRAARFELAEGVERSFMHVMAVDPQQRLAVVAPHDLVGCPKLVEQGQRLAHGGSQGTKTPRRRAPNIESASGNVSLSGGWQMGGFQMSHWSARVTRRHLLQTTAMGGAAAA